LAINILDWIFVFGLKRNGIQQSCKFYMNMQNGRVAWCRKVHWKFVQVIVWFMKLFNCNNLTCVLVLKKLDIPPCSH
jgi:hypothetical protein